MNMKWNEMVKFIQMKMFSRTFRFSNYFCFWVIFIHNINESIFCGLQMNTKTENGNNIRTEIS